MRKLYVKLLKKLIPETLKEEVLGEYREEETQRKMLNQLLDEEESAKENLMRLLTTDTEKLELTKYQVYSEEVLNYLLRKFNFYQRVDSRLFFDKLNKIEINKVYLGLYPELNCCDVDDYLKTRLVKLMEIIRDEIIYARKKDIDERYEKALNGFSREHEILRENIHIVETGSPFPKTLPIIKINEEGKVIVKEYLSNNNN
jgi:hypothetical protein